jgi:hypothetical protein
VAPAESKGDYLVGLLFGASFPSGSRPNGIGHTVLSPMLGISKGWGTFSIQYTFSGIPPTSGTNLLGRAFLRKTAFQYGMKNCTKADCCHKTVDCESHQVSLDTDSKSIMARVLRTDDLN